MRSLPVFFVSVNTPSFGECDGEVTNPIVVHELFATHVAYVPIFVNNVADFTLAVERVGASAPQKHFAVASIRGGQSQLACVGNIDILFRSC